LPDAALPQASDAELETITVKPSRKAAAKAPAKRRTTPAPAGPADPQAPEESAAEASATGAVESAWGPVDGYIATQSATGTKTATPILETPQGISVVGQEQIQEQGAQSVEEALTYTSGVRTEVYGFNPVYGSFFIRGFDVSSFDGLYRDGMKTSGDMQPEPFGVERIEVLKGPASVLYGQAPPGGLVNMVTKRPLTKTHHAADIEYGSFDRLQGGVDVGGPVSSKFYYRMTALVRDSETQVDWVPDDRVYFAPAFTWKPSADTTLTWLSYYQHDDIAFVVDVPVQGSLLPNGPYGRVPVHNNLGAPNFDSRINDVYSSGYELEHVLNDSLKVRQSLRYTGLDVDYKWSFPYFDGRIDPKTLAIFSTKSPYTEGLFTVDNNAVLTWGNRVKHTFLLGVDYRWANRADSYSEADAGTIDIYHPVYSHELGPFFHWEDSESTLSQTGFYFQEQAKFGEHRTVLIGGRKDLADAKNVYTDFSAGAPIRNASVQTDEAFTWRGGLVYLFNNGLAPYFSYSQAFEPVLGVDRLNNPFEPTTAEQYEAGIKFQPKGKQSFVTLSAFDITRANVLTPDPIDPNESIQTGEVTSQGFEAEATLDLSSGWKSIATYTYTYAIVTDSNDPAEIGTYFEAVPLNMASLWLLYEFQHGRMKGWGLGGGVRYVGDTFNRLNTLELPEYTLVDAVLQYKTGAWEFALNGRNIFDETYVSWCGDYVADDPTLFTCCRYGDARTVVARANYQW
jgi:iron complex outermembrane receptor protein